MIDLYLYKKKIENIFEFLGTNENDISFAIGLGFSMAPNFLKLFLKHIKIQTKFEPELIKIKLQQHEREKGYTDFEIGQEGHFLIIIEAKKGWNFPNQDQLDKYSSKPSFNSFPATQKKLVVFTESSKEYTYANFSIKESNSFSVIVVSYKTIWGLAKRAISTSNNYQKRFLQDLISYFEIIMTMQNMTSNMVYVVSLNYGKEKNWNISWIDIIEKKRKYFHPIGRKGFPAEPPNYIAFRYKGKLQSIHYIEDYKVFTDPNKVIKEIPSSDWGHFFLYHLSKPIIPSKTVKTGNIYRSGRVWAMIDLLLTCDSISDARDKTKERLKHQ
jgi:hypothetical protein